MLHLLKERAIRQKLLTEVDATHAIATLIREHRGKLSTEEIAELAGATVFQVRRCAYGLGLSLRKNIGTEEFDKIITDHQHTHTAQQVADMTNTPYAKVYHRARRLGINLVGMKK